jgi:hypothetical protein
MIESTPVRPAAVAGRAPQRLEINVIYNGMRTTCEALREASRLAGELQAAVRILVPVVVPLAFRLDRPPVAHAWTERRVQEVAAACEVETRVQVCYCRERIEALGSLLAPGSHVMLAGRAGWWRRDARRLARDIRRLGHQVTFIEVRHKNA